MAKLPDPGVRPGMNDLTPRDPAELQGRIEALDAERALVKSQLNRERLTEITDSLIRTITSPQVIESMKRFRDKAAEGASFEDAADLMSLESLRAAGAKLPEDFRLSSRVFEDFEKGIKFEIRPPKIADGRFGPTGFDPLGWGACAGGGAATVCGCAGGSS